MMTTKQMKCAALVLLASGLLGAVSAEEAPDANAPEALVKPGETVVLIGDSITQQAYDRPWGYYHVLTNAAPEINFIPLGFSGFQVRGWSEMERDSVANTNRWTWYRNPGWNLRTVLDGKVDVIVIFLGMNDILEPSLHDDEAEIGRWLLDYATFARNLRERTQAREMVFATITPLSADFASPKNRVRDKLNNRLRMLAAMTGARIADYGAAVADGILVTKSIDANYRLVPDFVHPNALGHLILAETLCATLGLDAAAEAIAERSTAIENDLMEANDARISVWASLDRTVRPADAEFVYDLGYSLAGDLEIAPEVRVVAPEGWMVDAPLKVGAEGSFRLRGRPTAAQTRIFVEAAVPTWSDCSDRPTGSRTLRASVDLPAPWKVCDESGTWRAYVASVDYTGGAAPGSIDPYELYFGWKTNTIHAARRVWSDKARDVKAVFSHQTFSATLDVTLAVNGAEVWRDSMNRNGRNRLEKTIHLNEGWNPIEITCTNRHWQRQFAFDLEPLAGDDLRNLKYDLP